MTPIWAALEMKTLKKNCAFQDKDNVIFCATLSNEINEPKILFDFHLTRCTFTFQREKFFFFSFLKFSSNAIFLRGKNRK